MIVLVVGKAPVMSVEYGSFGSKAASTADRLDDLICNYDMAIFEHKDILACL